jgi:hypothetical protein
MNPKDFRSQLESIKNLEERNLAFDELSDEEKRREIAYDCLQLTLEGKVKGRDGCYTNHTLNGYWNDELMRIRTNTPKEFQEILVNKLPECTVCARGGLMLSQIRLGNNISSDTISRYDGYFEDILKGFSMKSFRAMEEEYEDSDHKHPYEAKTTKKLQNICLNVIANGDFDIDDKTKYLVDYLN